MKTSALARACEAVGGQAALGRKIGRKQSTIWNWLKNGIPADQCPAIEQATDGAVTRYDLRPDVFGEAPKKRTAA
jgi:DNA-binding transcriptional regulator YdaS (Cro superfamily)